MIYKNNKTINEWYFNDSELIKVYKNGAICYYKMILGETPHQEPCFAVVDDITQYSDTEFVDVYDKATDKWYKLNNLDQYEQYGVYGSGRTITYYDGKLTIDNGYEYEWDGSEWDNLGEVSGSTQHDYTKDYLTFEPISSAVTYSHGMKDFQYSLDNGQTWITCTTADTVTVNVGQALLLKGNFGDSSDVDTNRFTANGGTWKAYGNLLSLIYGDNFASASTTLSNNGLMWAFYHCSNLVDIDNLTIPVTAISASRAFRGTFRDCGFSTVPDFLFYAQITGGTHTFMGTFEQCANLVKSPILPSTSVPTWGYYAMFNNCPNLREVTCLATNPQNSNNTTLWLNGVSSSGTFYKAINVNWGAGTNAIPNNWSVSEIVNPPVPPSPTVYIYPKYYTEKDEPENNVVFTDMAEALAYQCPWVGMDVTIDNTPYLFGDAYEWLTKYGLFEVSGEYMCDSGDKYEKMEEMVRNTDGTWSSQIPAVYEKGDLIESGSSDCSHSLPDVPFILNYNAKNYDATNRKLLKTEGQLRDSDAVCNYGYHIVDHSTDGYITVTGDTRMIISGTPYMNRNNTQTGCTMTIVSKVKTTNANSSYSILTNRNNQMNWMWRYPSNGIFLHGSSSYNNPKYLVSTTGQPITASIRISYNGSVKQQLNDWTNNGSYNGAFQYGSESTGNSAMFCDYTTSNYEFWKGDFYWVYMSFNVLTDEQIQQVIDYNENL